MTRQRVGTVVSRQRGFALLIVLWLLVPVSVLLLIMSGTARSDSQLAANLRDAAVLQSAADGGVETGIFTLLRPDATLAPIQLRINGAEITVGMTSLSGLINPNIAPPNLLRAVLIRIGASPQVADQVTAAILNWRTPGQRTPALMAPYSAAGRDYGPPGSAFESLAELRQVLGMTPELFTALEPLLTLYNERPPDPALAPPLVREALNDLGVRPGGGGGAGGTVFKISAAAHGAGARLVRREAVVKLGFSGNNRPWRILAWGTSPPGP